MHKATLTSIFIFVVFGFFSLNVSHAFAATLYFYSTSSANPGVSWDTVGNWWTDSGHTIAAGALPTTGDDVYIDSPIQFAPSSAVTLHDLFVAQTSGGPLQAGINKITVTGLATFGTNAFNTALNGVITGNVVLNKGFIGNNPSGVIGNVTFNNTAANLGTVTGNAIFNDSSYNAGTVTGTAKFTYAVGGVISIPNGGQWGGGSANAWVGVDDAPITSWIFSGTSVNNGPVIGDATFNDVSYNNYIVSGTAKFMHGFGGILTIPNGSQWGQGSAGAITGSDDLPITTWLFVGSSFTYGHTPGNARFIDTSINYGTVDGDACFSETATNNGTVVGVLSVCDITPPVVSSVLISDITPAGATISWSTDESSTSSLDYGTTLSYGHTSNSLGTTIHSVTLTGLTSNTIYDYMISATDVSLNTSTTSNATFTTDVLPEISGVVVSAITTTGATISWSTNKSTTSSVDYGTTLAYGSTVNSLGTTTHSVTLTGLTSGTLYNYIVNATDLFANDTSTSNATFTTATPSHKGSTGGSSANVSNNPLIRNPVLNIPTPVTPNFPIVPNSNTVPKVVLHYNNVLRAGLVNEDVRDLQKFLNYHGFNVSLTGPGSVGQETAKFGQKTWLALVAYQKSKGLTPDGVLGPKTLATMME